METLPKFGVSRADMMKRVARFKDLKGSDCGLPDSKAPHCERTLYNVIGFQPPDDEGGAVTSPVGDDASRLSAIPISEGFNLGYCRAKPGKGPMMHNHDTNETFIPMTGVWRFPWEHQKSEVESVDFNPVDVISFPPGGIRRRECPTSRVWRRRGPHVRHRRQCSKGRVHRQGDEGTRRTGRLAGEVTRCVIGDCRESAEVTRCVIGDCREAASHLHC
jgi:hypothetical protein